MRLALVGVFCYAHVSSISYSAPMILEVSEDAADGELRDAVGKAETLGELERRGHPMCSSYWYVNIAYYHLRFAQIACNVSIRTPGFCSRCEWRWAMAIPAIISPAYSRPFPISRVVIERAQS